MNNKDEVAKSLFKYGCSVKTVSLAACLFSQCMCTQNVTDNGCVYGKFVDTFQANFVPQTDRHKQTYTHVFSTRKHQTAPYTLFFQKSLCTFYISFVPTIPLQFAACCPIGIAVRRGFQFIAIGQTLDSIRLAFRSTNPIFFFLILGFSLPNNIYIYKIFNCFYYYYYYSSSCSSSSSSGGSSSSSSSCSSSSSSNGSSSPS